MKTLKFFRHILLLSFAFFLFASTLKSQYSGNYFVSDTSFFKTFSQVADSLISQGVDGMLTFQILPGVYEERITLENISGTGQSSQVTFKSYFGDSTQVILTDSCHVDSNYVIRMGAACSYFNFEGITIKSTGETYGRVVFLDQYPQHIRFSNCVLTGIYSSPSSNYSDRHLVFSSSAYIDYLTFENNLFEYGATALYLHGNNNGDGEILEISITNNHFRELGYKGILMHNPVAPVITGNTIQCYYGISIGVAYVTATILNNKIYAEDVGISLTTGGAFSPNALIANNFIHLGDNANRGISFGGGIGSIDIFHNTIITTESYYGNYGIYFGSNSLVPRYRVKNNIIACMNGGSPYYIYGLAEINEMDYNCYYTPGNFFAFDLEYSWLFNLQDFTDSTGFDEHSYMAYPYFMSDTNLHAKTSWFNNRGTPLADVTHDIDGEARDGTFPDIGADEYTPETEAMFSGSYSIGPGGYFSNIEQAIDSLKLKGVSANVSLEFLDGEYLVKSRIPAFSGAIDGNNITLTSQSSDATSVVLKHDNPVNDTNYIFFLNGADFLTIRDLTFDATSNITYGRNIQFNGGSEQLEISDNIFKGTRNTNNLSRLTLLYSSENFYRNLKISHNTIDSSAHGMYFSFTKTNWPKPVGIQIDSNVFQNMGYSGMFLQFCNSPIVRYNTINAGARGIQINQCFDSLRVIGNKVALDYGHAIYLSSMESDETKPGLIANNFASVQGTGAATGIYINSSDYQKVYHNSVNLTSTHPTSGKGLFLSNSNHLSVNNNIFSNTGGGYAYYATTSSFNSTDYNDLYATGTNLANIEGTNYTNLSALQAGTGEETNSVSTDPVFVSATDLHLADDTLAYLGLPIDLIRTDIDGDNRDLATPSIGADEYHPFVNTPPVVDSPISDTSVLFNTAIFNMALLDTVFADADPGDELVFSSSSDNANVFSTIESDILRIRVLTNYTGQATIVVSATDLFSAVARDTFIVNVLPLEDGFRVTPIDLDSISHGSVAWGDYDADGDLDLLITGWLGTNNDYISKIYRNDDAEFVETDIIIQGVSPGSDKSCAWTDFNNDGQLDFIIAGAKSGSPTDYYTMLYVQSNGVFNPVDYNLHNVTSSSVDWGDFDHDGDYDLLLSGKGSSTNYGGVFINNVNSGNTFTYNNFNMEGIWNSVALWGDFDADKDLDALLSGWDGTNSQYRNDSMAFSTLTSVLNSVNGHSADVGDYDMDGDLDIVMLSSNSDTAYSCVFRCEEHDSENIWSYSLLAYIQDIESGTAVWGDYDNDGDLDLFTSGTKKGFETHTVLYENHDGAFWIDETVMPNLGRSAAAWGDYDNDQDLDIILTGWGEEDPVSIIVRNDRSVTNTAPSVPTGLLEDIYSGKANLVWLESTDNETDQIGLTYNLRMGTTPGGYDIISPLSLANGYRQIPKMGNAGHGDSYSVSGLKPNTTYYWSVQAIDNCFTGSAFASEHSFTTLSTKLNETITNSGIKVRLYPNPVKDKLTIEFNLKKKTDVHIELYNEQGQKIQSKKYSDGNPGKFKESLNVKEPGLYILRIILNNQVVSYKVIR